MENGLLGKQNGITLQIEYYYFEDGVLHFFGASHKPKENIFFFPAPASPLSDNGFPITILEDVVANIGPDSNSFEGISDDGIGVKRKYSEIICIVFSFVLLL